MTPALLVLAAVFLLLGIARVGASRRIALAGRWPALLLAAAAILALLRGTVAPAFGLFGLAIIAWVAAPGLLAWRRARRPPADEDPLDADARRVLGLGKNPSEHDIRAAYRAKMAIAHPDLGGSHASAARLTSARDRLLRKLKSGGPSGRA